MFRAGLKAGIIGGGIVLLLDLVLDSLMYGEGNAGADLVSSSFMLALTLSICIVVGFTAARFGGASLATNEAAAGAGGSAGVVLSTIFILWMILGGMGLPVGGNFVESLMYYCFGSPCPAILGALGGVLGRVRPAQQPAA